MLKILIILGMMEQFLTELCTLDLENFQLFAVSGHFLRRCFLWRGAISVSQTSLVLVFKTYSIDFKQVIPCAAMLYHLYRYVWYWYVWYVGFDQQIQNVKQEFGIQQYLFIMHHGIHIANLY